MPTPTNFSEQGFPILENVTTQFTAEPPKISPFGSSVLKWNVTARDSDVVTINSIKVEHAGERTIRPTSTQTYTLAVNGIPSKSITVKVNLQQCIVIENGLVAQIIKTQIQRLVDEDPSLTFHQFPFPFELVSVAISPTRIGFSLTVRYDDGTSFPQLIASVFATFGLKIVPSASPVIFDNKVAASNISITVTPFPFPGFPLGFADENKEDIVAQKIKAGILNLVDLAVRGFNTEPAKMEPHSVSIGPGGFNDQGTVKTTYCPVAGPVVKS
jgi:hypothetical protein